MCILFRKYVYNVVDYSTQFSFYHFLDVHLRTLYCTDRGRKKSGVNPEDLFKAFTILKNVIGFLLMFVSPVVQIKGLGLQVINTVINIARFIYMVQNSQSTHHEIHLSQQPYSHDIQSVSHQTYGNDIPPASFHTYGKDIPPASLPTYGNDIPPVSHHTFSQDIHTQDFAHSNYIQPAHLQSYSYKNQEPNQHEVVSEGGPLRRYYSRLPSTTKKESYSHKKLNNTSR